ncbi:MAG: hypothetical protein ABIJ50_14285 [Pseudomonadota bacterium]
MPEQEGLPRRQCSCRCGVQLSVQDLNVAQQLEMPVPIFPMIIQSTAHFS